VKGDRSAPDILDLAEDVFAILFTDDVAKNGAQHPDD
jgi:hypothetical protein